MRRGAKTGEPREKAHDSSASKTWLVSRVARAGHEPIYESLVTFDISEI